MKPHRDHLRRYAADLEAATGQDRAELLATRALGRAGVAVPHRSLRWVMAGTATFLLVGSVVGVLADDAAPGQFLYTMDRAAESIGIGRGDAAERLKEALVVAKAGDAAAARLLAAEAVTRINPDLKPTPHKLETGTTEDPDAANIITLAVEAVLRSLEDPSSDVDGAINGLVLAIEAPAEATTDTTEATTTTTSTNSSTTTSTTQPPSSTEPTPSTEPGSEETTTTTTGGIILPPMP